MTVFNKFTRTRKRSRMEIKESESIQDILIERVSFFTRKNSGRNENTEIYLLSVRKSLGIPRPVISNAMHKNHCE